MTNKKEVIVSCVLLSLHTTVCVKKIRKSRVWQKNWLSNREKYGHIGLLKELRENDPDDFKNYLRMNLACFDNLLKILRSFLTKKDTTMRQSICAEKRLIATLRFLATGRSYEDLKYTTGISAQALGRIVPETCKVIFEVLQKEYLTIPTTKEEWKQVAEEFYEQWHIPNCGGAIDGKHIRIVPPAHTGALYYNYKHFYSVELMAVVNAKYEFLYVDVGKNGRLSDGGVFEETTFFQKLKDNALNLPENTNNKGNLNFMFICDEAFALDEHLLKPFPQRLLNHDRRIYNYRLSRGRNVVENAFGLIAARFRILQTPINVEVDNICYIVMTICVLHNFLLRKGATYCSNQTFDSENQMTHEINSNGEWRDSGILLVGLQTTRQSSLLVAKENRDAYVSFFNGEGAVPWQDNMLSKGKSLKG